MVCFVLRPKQQNRREEKKKLFIKVYDKRTLADKIYIYFWEVGPKGKEKFTSHVSRPVAYVKEGGGSCFFPRTGSVNFVYFNWTDFK